METFPKLSGSLLVSAYHCFDRIVIHCYLSGFPRPDPVFSKEQYPRAASTITSSSSATNGRDGW